MPHISDFMEPGVVPGYAEPTRSTEDAKSCAVGDTHCPHYLAKQGSPLCPEFNRLVLAIARDLMPEGWDIIPDAPQTLEEARAYYEKHGRVAVDIESKTGCTVGDPETHYAFRAWHDLIHVCNPDVATFTLEGERWAADRHREEIFKRLGYTPEAIWFGALIEIEIVAQNAHMLRLGYWPHDPRAFAERWLADRGFSNPFSPPPAA